MPKERLPMLVGTLALLVAISLAGWRQASPAWSRYQDDPRVRLVTPTLTNEPELCLTCHQGIEEIDDSHPVEAFGCVLCHGGEALSLDETTVHDTLIGAPGNLANPSDLTVAEVSCGGSDCHSGAVADGRDHIARANRGLHATYAGAVTLLLDTANLRQDSLSYGLTTASDDAVLHPDGLLTLSGFSEDQMTNAMVARFLAECTSCHVGEAGQPETYQYRSSGCASCHMLYTRDGRYQGGDPTLANSEPGYAALHRLTTAIPSSTCNTCHNRGEYDLETVTFRPRPDLEGIEGLAPGDRRNRELYLSGSTHFAACQYTLDCIDCHTEAEVMGSGDILPGMGISPAVECRTCHGTLEESPPRITLEDPNAVVFRLAQLNPFYDLFIGNSVLLDNQGIPMGHVRVEGAIVSLSSKTGERSYLIPQVAGSTCEQDVSQQAAADCQECHTYEP
jgi:hypothetical protein